MKSTSMYITNIEQQFNFNSTSLFSGFVVITVSDLEFVCADILLYMYVYILYNSLSIF